jgi:GNAT superfamily N-acetyltransferase
VVVDEAEAEDAAAVLGEDAGIAGAMPAQPAADDSGLVLIQAVPTVDPSDPSLGETVDRLRAELPGSAVVGGAAVENLDLKSQLDESTPLVVTVVMVLGFLLLLLALRALPDLPAPSRRAHLVRFEQAQAGVIEEALLVRDCDRVVGVASYQLPAMENLAKLDLQLIVHPQYRRRGIGTRLLAEVSAVARRHGRSSIEVETVRALPGGGVRDEAGYRYLTTRGHRPGAISIRSRYDVGTPVDEELLDEAWTHADGYSLVQWRDAVPEDIIDDVAALQSRLMLDAPSGDLAVEQQVYDADRVRDQERSELARGFRWYSTAARHDATGQIVARTRLAFESEDNTHARQRTTIVQPTHRGHRWAYW